MEDAPQSLTASSFAEQPTSYRTVESSQDFLAQIVGEENRAGERMQAGPILKLMYDTAVAVAYRHSGRRPVMLSMDRLDLTRMICHMDLLRLDGRVIDVGRSSMVVEVRCYVKRPTEREFTPSHVGFLTMVAIDEAGQPVRGLPPFSHDSPMGREASALAAHRRAQLAERRHAVEWVDQKEHLKLSDVFEPHPATRYDYLLPEETVVRLKGQVITPGPYQDRRVRAGDLLVWLDRLATYTARHFTRNENVVTISVNDVVFRKPLHATDRIELVARVVYVRAHTLEVCIDIVVHTLEGEQYELDSVQFFILNYHRSGTNKRITTGLRLTDDDQESLRRYLRARTRFNFWKSNPESHLLQSMEE